jgi:hypothetical protein
MYPSA